FRIPLHLALAVADRHGFGVALGQRLAVAVGLPLGVALGDRGLVPRRLDGGIAARPVDVIAGVVEVEIAGGPDMGAVRGSRRGGAGLASTGTRASPAPVGLRADLDIARFGERGNMEALAA